MLTQATLLPMVAIIVGPTALNGVRLRVQGIVTAEEVHLLQFI
jgi:hypothetical protein